MRPHRRAFLPSSVSRSRTQHAVSHKFPCECDDGLGLSNKSESESGPRGVSVK